MSSLSLICIKTNVNNIFNIYNTHSEYFGRCVWNNGIWTFSQFFKIYWEKKHIKNITSSENEHIKIQMNEYKYYHCNFNTQRYKTLWFHKIACLKLTGWFSLPFSSSANVPRHNNAMHKYIKLKATRNLVKPMFYITKNSPNIQRGQCEYDGRGNVSFQEEWNRVHNCHAPTAWWVLIG
jgi:hypothetical protein